MGFRGSQGLSGAIKRRGEIFGSGVGGRYASDLAAYNFESPSNYLLDGSSLVETAYNLAPTGSDFDGASVGASDRCAIATSGGRTGAVFTASTEAYVLDDAVRNNGLATWLNAAPTTETKIIQGAFYPTGTSAVLLSWKDVGATNQIMFLSVSATNLLRFSRAGATATPVQTDSVNEVVQSAINTFTLMFTSAGLTMILNGITERTDANWIGSYTTTTCERLLLGAYQNSTSNPPAMTSPAQGTLFELRFREQ